MGWLRSAGSLVVRIIGRASGASESDAFAVFVVLSTIEQLVRGQAAGISRMAASKVRKSEADAELTFAEAELRRAETLKTTVEAFKLLESPGEDRERAAALDSAKDDLLRALSRLAQHGGSVQLRDLDEALFAASPNREPALPPIGGSRSSDEPREK